MQRTERDPAMIRAGLERWLATRWPGSAVTDLDVPSANGMSSETVLFTATAPDEPGGRRLVARVAPEATAVPVFPAYDLARQARVMTDARRWAPTVPIPEVVLEEPDPSWLGTPFFVMERFDGRVPPDVMPYTFESWVLDATDAERDQLRRASVELLADLHGITDASARFAYLDVDRPGATAMRRQLADQAAYYDWAREGMRVPIIERTFAWLEAHHPADEGEPVMCWGDSRIGNILYEPDGFEPVAVLDWEMAVLAPAEVDLSWFAYLHTFFQDIAEVFELPGLPGFLRAEDCVADYEARSGRVVRNLDWFTTYAALRYAIVSIRTTMRRAHFGEAEMPEDPDDVVMHRDGLERLLARAPRD